MDGRHARLASIPLLAFVMALAGWPATAAIVFVGNRGGGCQAIPQAGGTHVITIAGSNTTAGNTLILPAATTQNATLASVTDSKGNTWTGDMSFAPSFRVFTYSARITTQLLVGDTITLTYSAAAVGGETSCAEAVEYSGIVLASRVDQTGQNSGTSSAPSVTTFGTPVQNNELLVGSFVSTAAAGGFGSPDNPLTLECSGTFCLFPAYRISSTASSGLQTVSATYGNSIAWGAILATYKDVVVPVELQRFQTE